MVEAPEVLAIILARGGSKSVPRKNIRDLAGCPLIAYSIAKGLKARTVTRLIVSTDDVEIAEIALRYGAEVPFLRPAEIAADDTPDLPVFTHALKWLDAKEGYQPQIIVHLRPTTPFCRVEDIDRGVELLRNHIDADSVRMVCPPSQNPFKMWRVGEDGFLAPLIQLPIAEPYNQPRQKLPPVLWQNGVDVTWRRTILELNSMTGRRILPLESSAGNWENWIDIDAEATFGIADYLLRASKVKVERPEPREMTSATATCPPVGRCSLNANVKLLVLDFDGVLTDNRVWVSEGGEEMVAVNRSDGMGIVMLRQRGIEVVVLSAEANPVVEARCRKLQIAWCSGVKKKLPVLRKLMSERGIRPEEVIYVGNDVNDLDCMDAVGFCAAVKDAHADILDRADLILKSSGGHGAVREICDLIIKLLN